MASKVFWRSPTAEGSGVQLIELNEGQLGVTEAGAKVLKSQKKNRNINLMFIFGNARSGKSYMMNCLAGQPGLFRVINSSAPCTKGVDISSVIIPHEAMGNHVRSYSKEPVPNVDDLDVGFVDVEGQGDQDGTHDTMLALPLLVTSKVVLFNHKGAPTVNDMLVKLGVLARAADFIDLEDEDQKADEKKPLSRATSLHTAGKKFGHLHVLFRDFSFEGTKEDVLEQLIGKESTKHLTKSGPGGSNDPLKAAKERNDIRELLNENFQSVNVWLFKQPANADQLREHKELPENLIDPEFGVTVKELLAVITQQLASPTKFNGNNLTGTRVQSLLKQVATQINTGGAVNVPSVFRAMEKETVLRTAEAVYEEFKKELDKIKTRLPVSPKELNQVLLGVMADMFKKFEDELRDCVLDQEKNAARITLEGRANVAIVEMERENKEAVGLKCKKVVQAKFAEMRATFEKWCKSHIPVRDLSEMDKEFAQEKEGTVAAIHIELRGLEGVTSTQDFEMLMIDCTMGLQELLQLKTIQNEAANKDAAILQLREAAVRQQEELIGQNKKLQDFVASEKAQTQEMEKQLALLKAERDEEVSRQKERETKLQEQERELDELRKKQNAGCCAIS
jgi:hypothetical protein